MTSQYGGCRSSLPSLVLALVGLATGLSVERMVHAQDLAQPGLVQSEDAVRDAESELPASELEDEELDLDDLLDKDLESLSQVDVVAKPTSSGEMLNTEVSTVARQDVSIAKTPAAVYVVTQEMIRRSGARNVMEVLRTVPGLHVARINASTWAISVRGLNNEYADKLLVQIDGRAVYTPVFGGVFWDQQLVPLRDIERIEVLRGPGGAVWGANAVNGVINIVTRSSDETTGVYAEAGGGSEHRSFSHGRVGGVLRDDATYRVYGMHAADDRGGSFVGVTDDSRTIGQGGFRVDWTPTLCDTVTVQGDYAGGRSHIGSPDDVDVSGANFLTRWTRELGGDASWSTQIYYDHQQQQSGPDTFLVDKIGVNTLDFDTQYNKAIGRHQIVIGAGYREYETYARTTPTQLVDFVPDSDRFDIISYFVQDTIELVEDHVHLTLGAKFEHNDFVGFVYQPSARVAITPDDRTSLWAAVSRSIRTPAVTTRDTVTLAPLGGGLFLNTVGNRGVDEEHGMTYELGLRRQASDKLYWDVACFFTRYEDLIRSTIVDPSTPVMTATLANLGSADAYGVESWMTYEAAPWCRLRGSYSLYFEDFDFALPTLPSLNFDGAYPRNMAYLGGMIDLTQSSTLDIGLRYVDSFPLQGAPQATPGYFEMDVRLARSFANGVEVSIVGQNLFDKGHVEFVPQQGYGVPTEVQRGVYGMVSWDY